MARVYGIRMYLIMKKEGCEGPKGEDEGEKG